VFWVARQSERLAKTYGAGGHSKAQIAYEIVPIASQAKGLGSGRDGEATSRFFVAMLGHTKSATTERYAHLADDPLRAANDRIGEELTKAPG
jgi:hypothetical protein